MMQGNDLKKMIAKGLKKLTPEQIAEKRRRQRPSAEVVKYPQGGELALAKEARTRKEELISGAGHNRQLFALLRQEREEEARAPARRDGLLSAPPAPPYGEYCREQGERPEMEQGGDRRGAWDRLWER